RNSKTNKSAITSESKQAPRKMMNGSSVVKMVQVEFDGSLIGHIHNARRCYADRNHNRVANLLFCRPDFQRFLEVPLQTALALGHQGATNSYQLFGLQVKRGGSKVALLVKRQIDVAKARFDHAHRLWGRLDLFRPIVRHASILTYSSLVTHRCAARRSQKSGVRK